MQDFLLFLQHHSALSGALVIVLIALTILEYIKSKGGTQQLSPALAIQMINHKNAVVLDVRNSDAFLTGHIVASISIPSSELTSKHKKLEKFKSQPIIIVSATGLESRQAVTVLAQQGFNTHVLTGGIRSWKDADMPLVKE